MEGNYYGINFNDGEKVKTLVNKDEIKLESSEKNIEKLKHEDDKKLKNNTKLEAMQLI